MTRVVVAGMGSEWRRDDGVGLVVSRRVGDLGQLGALDARGRLGEHSGGAEWEIVDPVSDPFDLLGTWEDADLAIVADATRSEVPPGTVRVVEVGSAVHVAPAERTTSSHGIGVAGALRLARAAGRAPRRTVIVGIEGEDFGHGEGLSPKVDAAVDLAARTVLELIESSG